MTDDSKFLEDAGASAAQVLAAKPIPQRAGFYCKVPEGFIYREHEIRQAKATDRLIAMVRDRDAVLSRDFDAAINETDGDLSLSLAKRYLFLCREENRHLSKELEVRDVEIAKLKTEANRQGADYVRLYADAFLNQTPERL